MVLADDYPTGFWSVNTKYEEALNNRNHADIVNYGNQIIKLSSTMPDSETKRNIMVSRYDSVGISYAAMGDYDNSARTYQALYDYIKPFTSKPSDLYYDNLVMLPAKIKQYQSQITMYTDKGISTYYHAKNEKENGVLFGICSNGQTGMRIIPVTVGMTAWI